MRQAVVVMVVLALTGAAFWGGTVYANAGSDTQGTTLAGGQGGGTGGPFAQLTEEERSQIQSMTDEERQAFMEDKFGDAAPASGMRGPGGGAIEGTVLEVAADSVTVEIADGGSQTFYTDTDTVIAYAEGAGELAAGSGVLVVAEPSTDGVTTASAVVVK